MGRRPKSKQIEIVEADPVTQKLPGVERIAVETIGEQDQITVTAGEAMVLRGRNGKGPWNDIAVISSNGGRCRIPKGRYTEFYLDPNTNSRMRFDPPVVTALGRVADAQRPRIVKEEK